MKHKTKAHPKNEVKSQRKDKKTDNFSKPKEITIHLDVFHQNLNLEFEDFLWKNLICCQMVWFHNVTCVYMQEQHPIIQRNALYRVYASPSDHECWFYWTGLHFTDHQSNLSPWGPKGDLQPGRWNGPWD